MTTADHTRILPNGTRVRYHGSLAAHHGDAVVGDFHREFVNTDGEYSPVRYILDFPSGQQLWNVRPTSFTVVQEPLTEAAERVERVSRGLNERLANE